MNRGYEVPDAKFLGSHRYVVINEVRGRYYWVVFEADRYARRVFYGKPVTQGSSRSYDIARLRALQHSR